MTPVGGDPAAPLPVHFDECDHGWILFRVPDLLAGAIWATHIEPPFEDMLLWLEEIARDRPAAWFIGQEGSSVQFVFVPAAETWLEWQPPLLQAITLGKDGGSAITARPATSEVVVRGFYEAIREFAGSDRYRPDHWEPRAALGMDWEDVPDGEERGYGWSGERLRLLRSQAVEAFLREVGEQLPTQERLL